MATLELAEHGMAGPLTCGASHVNVEAWYYYGLMHLPIMGLAKRSGALFGRGLRPPRLPDNSHQRFSVRTGERLQS